MKHEYHLTISRTDRIWLIVFVCILLSWELIKPLLPSTPQVRVEPGPSFPATTNSGADSSARKSNPYTKSFRENNDPTDASKAEYSFSDEITGPIDIMLASWKELRAIGFHPKVASNIERYVAAGGIIENKEQLMKIYGMDSAQWAVVSEHVFFPEKKINPAYRYPKGKESREADYKIIDINLATAEELEALPGIGTVLAERIIKYRNSLGGFNAISQVGECYGMPPETMEKISPVLIITQSPSRISINKMDLKNFNHPYLNRKMNKIVEAYIRQHGPLSGASDLRRIYPHDTTWCDKLLPYLTFE